MLRLANILEDGSPQSSMIASHVSNFLVCFTNAALFAPTNITGLQQCYAGTTFKKHMPHSHWADCNLVQLNFGGMDPTCTAANANLYSSQCKSD